MYSMISFLREGDVKLSVSHIRYYGGWADKISGGAYIPVLNSNQISCHTRREPVGVVVAVSQASYTSSSSSSSGQQQLKLLLLLMHAALMCLVPTHTYSWLQRGRSWRGGVGFIAAANDSCVVAAFMLLLLLLRLLLLLLHLTVPLFFSLLCEETTPVLKAAPALACGCTVVIKSSEKTPLTVLAFCKLMQKAGFPPGVFNVVNGWGDTVGATLIQHPLVNKVSFTGSSAVGKKVAQECAATMKRVTLELGGKSPLVILKDADIKKACEATWQGLFFNTGQCCVACSRILVQDEVYEQFTEQLKKCVEEKAKLLHPQDDACTQGPIVDQKQLNTVLEFIEQGKKEGAKCILGGGKKEGKGYWVWPTIFTDVTDEMKISKEEIFGPVVCVSKFKTIEEAVG
ncbi:hypothetical protein Emag_005433 [Eimeria magna]